MEFQDRLVMLRERKGLSQEALGKAIYVSRSAVAKWENGLGLPSDGNLQALCDYFGVEEDWLLDKRDLKKQITLGKHRAIGIIVALFGIVTVLVYVLLGFTLTFRQSPFIVTSYIYPTVSIFEFVVNHASNTAALAWLYVPAAVWAVHVLFAISSMAIPALKKRVRVCLWGNIGFILLSAGLFLTFFIVTVQAVSPFFILNHI